MNELKKLKEEMAQQRHSLEKVKATITIFNQKHKEISEKLEEIAASLSAAGEEQESAITRYARGEISEDKLDEFQTRISLLEGKKKSITAALGVVENDITGEMEKEKEIRERLKKYENGVWGLIAKTELAKGAAPLRRAFAALMKCNMLPMPGIESREIGFLKDQVYNAVFCAGGESYEVATDEMTKEYLEGGC